ncbi:MAG TPA: hypothetical protein VEV16_02115 [Daejeonella sp.]|nr:hypothetical protein [Daejeonella sp.]
MQTRLTPEERHLRSIQNVRRLADQERRKRLLNFMFKKSRYFKISLTIRIFFIVFTCLAFYPALYVESHPKKVTGIKHKYYYGGGKWTATKHPYVEFATHDGYYLPVTLFYAPIKVGDTVLTYRNILFKKAAILQENDGYIHRLSGPFPGLAGLIIISIFSILSFQKRYATDTRRINFILSTGSIFVVWYYIEYLISL